MEEEEGKFLDELILLVVMKKKNDEGEQELGFDKYVNKLKKCCRQSRWW